MTNKSTYRNFTGLTMTFLVGVIVQITANAAVPPLVKPATKPVAPPPLVQLQSPLAAEINPKFSTLTYGDLAPRMLVQMTDKVIDALNRNPEYQSINGDPLIVFTKEIVPLKAGQLFRVLYVSSSDDYSVSLSNGTETTTGYENYRFTLIQLDAALRPYGEQLDLAVKAQPGQMVAQLKGMTADDPLLSLQTLTYKVPRSGDVLMNVVDVMFPNITIPAYTSATVVSVYKKHVPFTFTDDYRLVLSVDPCPRELQVGPPAQRCQVTMENTGYIKDPLWVHWVNPKNWRILNFHGIGISY